MTILKAIITTLDILAVIIALAATMKEERNVQTIGGGFACLMVMTIYLMWS